MVFEEDIFHRKLSKPQIGHILSFLPTRDAVKTSVLSKEWVDNWTFVTKLNFDDTVYYDESHSVQNCTRCNDECYREFYVSDKVGFHDLILCKEWFISHDVLYNDGVNITPSDLRKIRVGSGEKFGTQFQKFVYRAILHTQYNTSPIPSTMLEGFTLTIINRHDVDDLNIWLSSILKRRVKKLIIHSPVYDFPFYDTTSNQLLNSTLLEELELVLQMFTIINVPNSVHFGHLKHLKLCGIIFVPSSVCFTLSLPVLKTLVIRNCDWTIEKELYVKASLLEHIFIHQDMMDLLGRLIKFNSMCLKEFTYSGYGISHKIDLSGCSFLSSASVKFILRESKNIIPKTTWFGFELFHHFHQVKCIKLECSEFLTLSEVSYPISAIPELANLIHLELALVSIEVVLALLERSLVLQTIVLKKIRNIAKENLNLAVVPECLRSSLETVTFEKVNGGEQELCLAEFLLEKG